MKQKEKCILGAFLKRVWGKVTYIYVQGQNVVLKKNMTLLVFSRIID